MRGPRALTMKGCLHDHDGPFSFFRGAHHNNVVYPKLLKHQHLFFDSDLPPQFHIKKIVFYCFIIISTRMHCILRKRSAINIRIKLLRQTLTISNVCVYLIQSVASMSFFVWITPEV